MSNFMKKPCEHCPYREDVKPFLAAQRGEELAYLAQNRYNTFHCHKTTESVDEGEGGPMEVVETSKICAGFLSLQHNENGETFYDKDGFKPSSLVYNESYDMEQAYYDNGAGQ
jgi:hypothetical protein|tara:strand:- start:934 stop:1272 length:339 start_codon:yes stop_codon:yes gene_type:complete